MPSFLCAEWIPGKTGASPHFSARDQVGGVRGKTVMAQECFPQRVLVSEERAGHYVRASMCALRGKGQARTCPAPSVSAGPLIGPNQGTEDKLPCARPSVGLILVWTAETRNPQCVRREAERRGFPNAAKKRPGEKCGLEFEAPGQEVVDYVERNRHCATPQGLCVASSGRGGLQDGDRHAIEKGLHTVAGANAICAAASSAVARTSGKAGHPIHEIISKSCRTWEDRRQPAFLTGGLHSSQECNLAQECFPQPCS